MLARLLPRLLLIVALLLTQLGGLAHGVSHVQDGHGGKPGLAHEKHCDLCAEYAQLGGALNRAMPSVDIPPHAVPHGPARPDFIAHTTSGVYAARAPPRFI